MASRAEAPETLQPPAREFYRRVMLTLRAAGIEFLVGGSYSLSFYTGLERHSKDFDLFVRPADFTAALEALSEAGLRSEPTFPHWLGKVYDGDYFVDIIFSSGNGLARVDDSWFAHAAGGEVFGEPVRLCPAEETLWSKAFIMERERFDGADVAHLLLATAPRLDWPRLVARFGPHWRVLLAHLVLFGFIYPAAAQQIPRAVLADLASRLAAELHSEPPSEPVCRGTVLSRAQYLTDIHCLGYLDARLPPEGAMSLEEVEIWTAGIAQVVPEAVAPVRRPVPAGRPKGPASSER